MWNGNVGFVPTMGFLHAGHASLLQRARNECDHVVLSVFVNPLQFGENEDLDSYPRNLEQDIQVAEKEGVDVLFIPSVREMYPSHPLIELTAKSFTNVLCGKARPGHFEGVLFVVTKLFHMVNPHKAYFGAKDAQQVVIIQKLVEDLSFPIEIVVVPTAREEDGLAMSSRNVYLSNEERSQAKVIPSVLKEVRDRLTESMFVSIRDIHSFIQEKIKRMPLACIDYIDILSYPSMTIPENINQGILIIAVAVRFGRTRLIDNLIFDTRRKKTCFEQ